MNRLAPKVQYGSTVAPIRTKVISCMEWDCDEQREGFVMVLPLGEDESMQSQTVRSGNRRFAEFLVTEGDAGWEITTVDWGGISSESINTDVITAKVVAKRKSARVFAFPPGERCFRVHRIATAPPVLTRGEGSRAQVQLARTAQVMRPAEWLERFKGDTEAVNELKRREGVDEMIKEANGG